MDKEQLKRRKAMGVGIAIGISIGAGLGGTAFFIFDSWVPVIPGMSVGVAIGIVLGVMGVKKSQ